jgi:hypothetical protein
VQRHRHMYGQSFFSNFFSSLALNWNDCRRHHWHQRLPFLAFFSLRRLCMSWNGRHANFIKQRSSRVLSKALLTLYWKSRRFLTHCTDTLPSVLRLRIETLRKIHRRTCARFRSNRIRASSLPGYRTPRTCSRVCTCMLSVN